MADSPAAAVAARRAVPAAELADEPAVPRGRRVRVALAGVRGGLGGERPGRGVISES
jgi:hypothetical protein